MSDHTGNRPFDYETLLERYQDLADDHRALSEDMHAARNLAMRIEAAASELRNSVTAPATSARAIVLHSLVRELCIRLRGGQR